MPQDGRRSVGYRPFVTCNDLKGVVECGTIRKTNKSNFQKMEPSSEARVRLKSSNRAADRGELNQASFQLLEVSKGAQKLNHVIESWSNGMNLEGQPRNMAKDLLKGALNLQESLMMLGKLQAASMYMARLKRKQEKLKNSGAPSDVGHGREIGLLRLESSPWDETSRKKIEELREVIRISLARQNQLDQRRFELHLGIPPTRLSQSSSVNYNEKDDLVTDKKAKALKTSNIIAKLMGLEEISLEPKQRKLQDKKIMNQQKPEPDSGELKLKKTESEIRDDEPDRKTLKEILDSMQSKGHLKSSSIRETPVFNADDVPPIVLIKPSRGQCPESSEALVEGNGTSNAISVLKSLKANEKFPSRRIVREEIVRGSRSIHETPQLKEIPGIASFQKRGSTRLNEEISRQEKEPDSQQDSNEVKHPIPHVKEQVIKEKYGKKYGKIAKATNSNRRSPEKASCKAKSSQQSEDQVKANAQATTKPENRPTCMKRQVSSQRTRNGREDGMKKETSTPVQRSKKTVSNQHTWTPSQSCGDRNRSTGKKPHVNKLKEVTAAKLDKNNAAVKEDGIEIDTICRGDSNKLEMSTGNESPHLAKKNASESVVGVSNSSDGIENSPIVLSPSASELRTETEVQKLDFGGFGTGDCIKSLLLSSPSFVSHVEQPKDVDFISASERLLIDYADELMECRTFHPSSNSVVVVGLESLESQISLDNLLEDILKGVENLSSYSRLASNSFLMDGLYARLKRDLSVNRKSVSKIWDAGWTKGFCLEDAEHVVNEMEENVLGCLIEETLIELMK